MWLFGNPECEYRGLQRSTLANKRKPSIDNFCSNIFNFGFIMNIKGPKSYERKSCHYGTKIDKMKQN